MNNGPTPGVPPFLGCCCAIFGFLIVLCISATILRMAVWIVNKFLPESVGREDSDDYGGDWDSYERLQRRIGGPAVPPPTIGWSMSIVFVTMIVQGGVYLAMTFVAIGGGGPNKMPNPQAMLGLFCCNTIVGLCISVGLRGTMLPTSVGRAFLVALFEGVIMFAIGAAVFMALMMTVGMPGLK